MIYAYEIGQQYKWLSDNSGPDEIVTVAGLRKRGHAILSNGWVVDEGGVAEGTQRIRGGKIVEAPTQEATEWL